MITVSIQNLTDRVDEKKIGSTKASVNNRLIALRILSFLDVLLFEHFNLFLNGKFILRTSLF